MLKYVRIVHKSLCIFLSTVVEDPWLSFPQLGWALGWDLQGSVVLVLTYSELTTPPDPYKASEAAQKHKCALYCKGARKASSMLVAH